jgi:acetyltransferase-like isoleucine patch superfamily enzyme
MKKSLWKRSVNRILHLLCRVLPGSTSLRPILHRARGVAISGRVFIGDDVYIDGEYPERIEIQDGVQIGPRTMIIAHTRGPGRVVLEKNVFVGVNCVIVTAQDKTLTIGEGSVLSACSLVTADVPSFTLMGGERAKPLAKVTRPFTDVTTYNQFICGLRSLTDRNGNLTK